MGREDRGSGEGFCCRTVEWGEGELGSEGKLLEEADGISLKDLRGIKWKI